MPKLLRGDHNAVTPAMFTSLKTKRKYSNQYLQYIITSQSYVYTCATRVECPYMHFYFFLFKSLGNSKLFFYINWFRFSLVSPSMLGFALLML